MNIRIQKILNTFIANRKNLFVDSQKRYFDKTRDNLAESQEKYEHSHDKLLAAIRGIRSNWVKFLENQTAKKFTSEQRDVIDDFFWGKKTPNLISTKLICNSDLDHAVGLFHYFLGFATSLNWPHGQ